MSETINPFDVSSYATEGQTVSNTEPVQSEPVQTETVQSEPVQSEPVQSEPIQASVTQTEPVKVGASIK